MKKICLVSDGTMPIPPVKGGAVETLIQFLVEQNEIEQKVFFYIISLYNEEAERKSKGYKYSKYIYILQDNYIERKKKALYRYINKASKIFLKNEITCYSAFYQKACKKIIDINPDYIVCEGGAQLCSFSYFAKYFASEKLVVHLHGNWFPSRKVSNTFGMAIAVSEFVAKEYKSTCTNNETKMHIVYNCINETVFCNRLSLEEKYERRKKLGFASDDFIIVFCGRICEDKGVKELIESVIQAESKVKLLIIGSPNYGMASKSDYLNKVKMLVNQHDDKIKFTGYIPNDELWRYHSIADCMAVPSMWEEPAGMTAIEGMTVGLPLVITDSGGLVEEVTEECAIIVERKHNVVKQLTEAFDLLATQSDLCVKMGKASYRKSVEYSRSIFYDEYVKCFTEK